MALFSVETLAIQVYRSSLEQRRGIFPKNYFLDENGRLKAQVCLRYMLNNYAVYETIEDIYAEFADTENPEAFKKLWARLTIKNPLRQSAGLPP